MMGNTEYYKRKEKLKNLEANLKNLQKEIRNARLENVKTSAKKNTKKSLKVMQLVAPYILTTGLVIGSSSLTSIPFHQDDVKKYLHTKKEMDNQGNIKTEKSYDKEETTHYTDILDYCSKWAKNEDGIYERNVQRYSLKNVSEVKINELLNGEISVSDILVEPISTFVETSINLSEEELEQEEILEATVYDVNKKNFIVVKESVTYNIIDSTFAVFAVILSLGLTYKIRKKASSFDFKKSINEIEEEYKPINTNYLISQYEENRYEYNRLVRKKIDE